MTKATGMLGGGAVGVAVAVVGYVGLWIGGFLDTDASVAVPAAQVTPEPANASDAPAEEKAVAPEAEGSENPVVSAPAPLNAPEFGLRVEADGAAIVAGQGTPGAGIAVLLDGKEIADTSSGRDGKFAVLMDIPPSSQPRVMALSMRVGEREVFSDTEIIVAPFGPAEGPVADGSETVLPNEAPTDPVMSPSSSGNAGEETQTGPRAAKRSAAQKSDIPTVADAPRGIELAPVFEAQTTPVEEMPVVADEAPDAGRDKALASVETSVETSEARAPESETPTPVAQAEASVVLNDASIVEADAPDDTPIAPASQSETAETMAPETGPELVADVPLVTTPEIEESVGVVLSPNSGVDVAGAGRPIENNVPEQPKDQAAPTLLASDEEGVRILPRPEVPDRVAIDTISYDDAGDVALAGRGVGGGGFVRIYLDNAPITTSRIREDGSWRVTLPEVEQGVYTLRVDQVGENGDVRSRAETPFQREDREALESATGAPQSAPVRIVTVQPGNTLWQIARDRYGEGLLFVRVFDANRAQIRNPDLIYPGQVFDLPPDAARE